MTASLGNVFRAIPGAPEAVRVTLSLIVAFTDARCRCGQWLMRLPGKVKPEARLMKRREDYSGRGHAASCGSCGQMAEVIAHAVAGSQ